MYCVRKYTAILTVTAAVSLLVASCGSNKIADCNRIIEISNKDFHKSDSVGKKNEKFDSKKLLEQADQAAQKAKAMEVLELRDGNLKDYKTRFVKAYKDESKALRDAAKSAEDAGNVANKSDTSSINASLKTTDMYLKATEVYSQQLTIVNELTTYCTK